jgi:hypothetical protein
MTTGSSGTHSPAAFNLAASIDAAIVDRRFRGTDRYLDLVTWNIRGFNSRDAQRVENMVTVLVQADAGVRELAGELVERSRLER